MIAKTFEIRDSMTFIPALAVLLNQETKGDTYLLSRIGIKCGGYVLFTNLNNECAQTDPRAWDTITMKTAHQHIMKYWYGLESGDVIDVEYIRGISNKPKESERVSG